MTYYDTFMKLSPPPAEYHRNSLQELVNYEFENASTYYTDIEEEVSFGSLEFRPCPSRITSIIDAKTGQRVNDDYKKIIFKDLKHNPMLGTRYRFENNIWIVYSTDNMKRDTSSVYVRRCNSTINTQDKYGNIHREPCYIDYKVTETQPFRERSIDVPNGRIWVQCQYNEWTKDIDVNYRFMFGKNTYKIREEHDFDRLETMDDDSVPTVSFYADYDEVAPDDNKSLKVANYKEYNYSISSIKELSGTIGDMGTIPFSVTLDGVTIDEDVIFESNNPEVLDVDEDGIYKMKNIGSCNIIIIMKNNISIRREIKVEVLESSELESKDILEPDVRVIKLNKTQTYSICEYTGSVQEPTKFEISCHDVPNKNFKFENNGNNFSITNLKTTENILLKVVCINTRTLNESVIYIRLGGLF